MNFQKGANRIGWTDATWNVIGGCPHDCHWLMITSDGRLLPCYADTNATGLAHKYYPHGFAHYYFHPERLVEPLQVKVPLKIFPDSMSDMLAHWTPREHLQQVIEVMRKANWHIFQPLTKNPKRYLEFRWPKNVWCGFSLAPTMMNGHRLNAHQQERFMEVGFEALRELRRTQGVLTWNSAEPLSWDCASQYENCGLQWAVIGAASNGHKKYQPDQMHLANLLNVLDKQRIPVYFKENLTYTPRREEFPS